mmetsp:Transcript_12147/g.30756  ORF Transcript_12147/g.30756 Transcript_12147/m.30756 type:complete len:574 (-) Transcript_12147:109-1830(-)|eukprot:CAMPEP_0174248854 /NCGR_PEP_ID=MMETSP0417-20130205/43286_1 /TAXON_ID=242541 /ORGANISM="Mayorella sp, Strain BSH-02190019" /LENGTH=573 /DNA_ID=CAMNT_0015328721 /DNA_START=94 /DNA_END=1815 /DNA_ORIENTATION=+
MSASPEYERLLKKPALKWSISEVALWLDFVQFKEYKIEFLENCISGAELADLGSDDLVALGVSRLGHRKRLVNLIAQLFQQDGSGGGGDTDSVHSGSSRSSRNSRSSSSSSSSKGGKITCKCMYKGETQALSISRTASLNQLKRKIKREFGRSMQLKYEDEDGDKISLRKDRHLRTAMKNCEGGVLRIHCRAVRNQTAAKASERELKLLDSMIDAIVVIDEEGLILHFNVAATKMFGWSKRDVVNRPVTILMPEEHARVHHKYVQRYVETGHGDVMNKGRRVQAKRKSGELFDVYLTLSESKTRHGARTFTGTLQDMSNKAADDFYEGDVTSQFTLLDNLLQASLCIDPKGTVVFINREACQLLGYQRTEVLNQNVKMLMTGKDSAEHDRYLADYARTGEKHVIGTGRDVVAQKRDGTLIPVRLSVTEARYGTKTLFTGMLAPTADTQKAVGDAGALLRREREVLQDLLIPAVIMDEEANIQMLNEAALDLWGYELTEVVGRNVKMLMPAEVAKHHDGYVKKFLETGKGTVFGVGREVNVLTKEKKEMPVRLSVTKKRDESGKYIFTGIVQQR